jgi:hypothetical protein
MVPVHAPAASETRPAAAPESIGRVAAITGSEATIDLSGRIAGANTATVGKFVAIVTAKGLIVGLITQIGEQAMPAAGAGQPFRKVAEVDMIGEIRAQAGGAHFQRGVSEYPNIGDAAIMLTDAELKLIYGSPDGDSVDIGHLQQNPNVHVHIDIEQLVSRHFAIV